MNMQSSQSRPKAPRSIFKSKRNSIPVSQNSSNVKHLEEADSSQNATSELLLDNNVEQNKSRSVWPKSHSDYASSAAGTRRIAPRSLKRKSAPENLERNKGSLYNHKEAIADDTLSKNHAVQVDSPRSTSCNRFSINRRPEMHGQNNSTSQTEKSLTHETIESLNHEIQKIRFKDSEISSTTIEANSKMIKEKSSNESARLVEIPPFMNTQVLDSENSVFKVNQLKNKIDWPSKNRNEELISAIRKQITLIPAGYPLFDAKCNVKKVSERSANKIIPKRRNEFNVKPQQKKPISRFTKYETEDDEDWDDWDLKTITRAEAEGKLSKCSPLPEAVKKEKLIEEPTKPSKQCECKECDLFLNCASWRERNLKFDAVPETESKKSPPLLQTADNLMKQIKLDTFFSNNVFINGVMIPKAVKLIEKTCFNEDIKNVLKEMGCTNSTHIQGYGWPAVQRRMNLFMTGPSGSGKTLSYLPAICSFILEKDRYTELSKYEGPLAVILCSNEKSCTMLQNLINKLLKYVQEKPVVEIVLNSTKVKKPDLVVTTPLIFEECLKSEVFGVKRLCHLILEEGDILLSTFASNLQKIFKLLHEVQANRSYRDSIQIILSTEKWTSNLTGLLKKLYVTPLVCFSNYLEAALYSDVKFKTKKCKPEHKRFYLNDILNSNYTTRKCVVFCDSSETEGITEYFELNGIDCIPLTDDLAEDELNENEDLWLCIKRGQYKVLLCTDELFGKTERIKNADWIVHCSLPSNWKLFESRFRCLAASLVSPLSTRNEEDTCHSFIIISDGCDQSLFSGFFESLSRNVVSHFKL